MANRPLWPRTAELFAQADEALADIRSAHARIDRSLAEIFLAATQRPFPEVGEEVWGGCSCAFGPRCESNRFCEDEAATIGAKDRRTGTIRARAEYSMFHPFSRGSAPRLLFYCGECFALLKESWGKPIRGLHPPKGVDEFWRPSFLDMIRHASSEISRQERSAQPPATYEDAVERYTLQRIKNWTPAQRAQAEYVRRRVREDDR
jgi:hypothetical protein